MPLSLTTALTLSTTLSSLPTLTNACTALAVDKKATTDGSHTFVSHNDDASASDFRLAYVPASQARGTSEPIYHFQGEYPRYVGYDRGETYLPDPALDQKPWKPLFDVEFSGEEAEKNGLAQFAVEKTYGFFENEYPLLNDAGLTMGESTCGSTLINSGIGNVTVGQLMRIAQGRCSTARCAIKVMGLVAQKHGFFGEDPGQNGAAEAVTLGDGDESWVFHVNGDGDSSAVWIGQRVPDGHVAVVANAYTIREVSQKDCDAGKDFLCSDNLFSVAREKGLWKEEKGEDKDGVLDFARVYGADELNRPGYYVTSRWWRVFDLVAPSLKLKATENFFYYPFSVKTEIPISRQLMEDIMGDHFVRVRTDFDQTKGIFAGPFGNPNRLEGGSGLPYTKAIMPRAIAIPRTNYGVIGQSFSKGETGMRSIMWLCQDTPDAGMYLPFFQGTGQNAVSASMMKGTRANVDRGVVWWGMNLVSNQMNQFWSLMNQDVQRKRKEFRSNMNQELEQLSPKLLMSKTVHENDDEDHHETHHDTDTDDLAKFSQKLQQSLLNEWLQLHDTLLAKYLDGYWNDPKNNFYGQTFGYPLWFLEMSGADKMPKPKFPYPAKNDEENLKNIPSALKHYGQGPFEPLNGYLEKPGLMLNLTEHVFFTLPTPEYMPDVRLVKEDLNKELKGGLKGLKNKENVGKNAMDKKEQDAEDSLETKTSEVKSSMGQKFNAVKDKVKAGVQKVGAKMEDWKEEVEKELGGVMLKQQVVKQQLADQQLVDQQVLVEKSGEQQMEEQQQNIMSGYDAGYDGSHLIFMLVGVVAGMVVVSAVSSIRMEKDDNVYRALDF